MVSMLAVLVLASLAVPLQPATRQPAAGVAVRLIASPATYCPALQPADLAGVATGSLPWPLWLRVRPWHCGGSPPPSAPQSGPKSRPGERVSRCTFEPSAFIV